MSNVLNTIIAKDERLSIPIKVAIEFHRGITDIEYDPGENKSWKEKMPDCIYYYFRCNNFKFISKRQGHEEVMMDEYVDEFHQAILSIPEKVLLDMNEVVEEARDVMGKRIGFFNNKISKIEKKMIKARNELSELAKEYKNQEDEFLQEYFTANAENIKAYMIKKYNLEDNASLTPTPQAQTKD